MEAEFDDPFASLTEYDEQSVNNPPMEIGASCSPAEPHSVEPNDEEMLMDDEPSEQENSPFVPPSIREDAPLANIVGQEFQHIDPRFVLMIVAIFNSTNYSEYFPEFKRTGILRFSRMFGVNPKALRQNMIWWPSKTFCNKPEQQQQLESDQASNGNLQLIIGPDVTKDQCVYDQTVSNFCG
jgi:hypothetical protein